MSAGAAAVLTLLWRATVKPPDQRVTAVGAALIVAALAAPTVHAWYVVWGLGLVAATGGRRARSLVAALSVALTFTALPDPLARHPLGLALIVLTLVAAMGALVIAHRSDPSPWSQREHRRRRTTADPAVAGADTPWVSEEPRSA